MMTRKELDLWVDLRGDRIGRDAVSFAEGGEPSPLFRRGYVSNSVRNFENIGSLKVRAPVKSAGVVVGRRRRNPFRQRKLRGGGGPQRRGRFKFPKDSSAKIMTSGLLGEQYISFRPGDSVNLKSGG